jgi:hypothetical protein
MKHGSGVGGGVGYGVCGGYDGSSVGGGVYVSPGGREVVIGYGVSREVAIG